MKEAGSRTIRLVGNPAMVERVLRAAVGTGGTTAVLRPVSASGQLLGNFGFVECATPVFVGDRDRYANGNGQVRPSLAVTGDHRRRGLGVVDHRHASVICVAFAEDGELRGVIPERLDRPEERPGTGHLS